MIAGIELFLRRLRNRVSRTTWAIRNFGLSSRRPSPTAPEVLDIRVPRTGLAITVSDHLPLVVDLGLKPADPPGASLASGRSAQVFQ